MTIYTGGYLFLATYAATAWSDKLTIAGNFSSPLSKV
jgi:hypothetical protein